MILRVKLIGTGKLNDSYHVSLPTYSHIHGNIEEKIALISVAPNVLGLTEDDLTNIKSIETTEGLYYPKLHAKILQRIQKHLDTAYPGKNHKLELAIAK